MSKIEKVKTLCNVAEEAPDNVAQEKILINVEPKKVILFPEITRVKMFLSFIHPHSRVCIRIYIFNFQKKKEKENKKNSQKTMKQKNNNKKTKTSKGKWSRTNICGKSNGLQW